MNHNIEIENKIRTFLASTEAGVLILGSMDSKQRDKWVKTIAEISPKIHIWTHSKRVVETIRQRETLRKEEIDSIYSTLYYGGILSLDQQMKQPQVQRIA